MRGAKVSLKAAAILGGLGLIVLMAVTSVRRYVSLVAGAFDLGIYSQEVWLIRHGLRQFCTVRGTVILSDHFYPILYPLSVLYFLWEDPRILLLFQTLLISSGAIPLFLLSRRRVGSEWLGLTVALCYLLYPALHWVNWFDFHPISLAMPLILWGVERLEVGRLLSSAIFFGLSLLCRQDVALPLAILGIYPGLKMNKRFGLGLSAFSILYFLFALKVMGIIGGYKISPYIAFYDRFGETPKEIAFFLLSHPRVLLSHFFSEKVYNDFWDKLLRPLCYLPLLRPDLLLPSFPTIALNLLSKRGSMQTIHFHYTSLIIPFFFLALVEAVRFLRVKVLSRWMKIGWADLLLCLPLIWSSCCSLHSLGPYGRGFFCEPIRRHAGAIKALLSTVPSRASVSSSSRLLPHLAHRREIYMFPNPFIKCCYGTTPEAVEQQESPLDTFNPEEVAGKASVDYICLYVGPDFTPWPMEKGTFLSLVATILSQSPYGVERAGFGTLILRKGKGLRDTFKALDINSLHSAKPRSAIWGKLLSMAGFGMEDLFSLKGAKFVKPEEGFLAPEIAFVGREARAVRTTQQRFIIGPVPFEPDDLLSFHASLVFLAFLKKCDGRRREIGEVARALEREGVEAIGIAEKGARCSALPVFLDVRGEVFEAYKVGASSQGFLVNPNGVIVWRGRPDEVLEFLEAMERSF